MACSKLQLEEGDVPMDQDEEVGTTAQAWLADWRSTMTELRVLLEPFKAKAVADAVKNANKSVVSSLPNPGTEGSRHQIDLTPVGPPGRQGAAWSNKNGQSSVNLINSGGNSGRRRSSRIKVTDVGDDGLKSEVTPKCSRGRGPQIPLSVGLVDAKKNVYSIEEIVDARMEWTEDCQKFMYKVKWTGWPSVYNSWIEEEDFGTQVSINNFWRAKMRHSNNKRISPTRQGSSSSSKTQQLTPTSDVLLECFL